MEDWDKINAVTRMQAHIVCHIDEKITLETLGRQAGYSPWHAARLFKEFTGMTPFAYLRAARLTAGAKALRDSEEKVLDIALDQGFDSHDGFTRAFAKRFAITPQRYRREKPPLCFFTHYPVREYYLLCAEKRREDKMEGKCSRTVTVQAVQRPARKLILLRSKKAADYFSFCEEKGCDWVGLLGSVPEKFDSAAILTLPQSLVTPGASAIAAGIEVPAGYEKQVPAGYETLLLPPCAMLYFQGMPYENEEDFCEAIDIVGEAVENYRPEAYGYAFADDLAPRFAFGASARTGARMAVPVRIIEG